MASIRRTMSPATNHDRPSSLPNHHHHHHHHAAPFSATTRPASPSAAGRALRRLLRWHQGSWRRCFLRFFVCFLLGFLGGFYPFYDLDDFGLKPHDFHFSPIQILSPPPPPPPPPPLPPADQKIDLPRRDLNVVHPIERNLSEMTTEEPPDFAGKVNESSPNKLLIMVTPTYNRALQAYYLNRLGQTLKLVPPPVLWIVVEMGSPSRETADILRRTGVMYRHLYYPRNRTRVKDRGVHQRNIALKHIRQHRLDGIVYFADDDNIYTLELFDRMREIRRFGTWPVAMLAQSKSKAILEGPVCNGSQVIGWHTNEKSKQVRRFHVDMSGFAFNSTIIWDPNRWHRPYLIPVKQLDTVKEGFQETTFIQQIVEDESQMEGLPSGCSKIMNWHLHLEASNLVYPRGWQLSKNLDAILTLK